MPETKPVAKPVAVAKPLAVANALSPSNVAVSNIDDLVEGTKGGFMPRLQLMSSSTGPVKTGKFKTVNNYGIVDGSEIIDAGAELDVLVLAGHMKAMEMGDATLVFYDRSGTEYKRIEGNMKKKGQSKVISYCGPEFLFYIPQCEKFVTFYMGSRSASFEGGPVTGILKAWQAGDIEQPAGTLKSKSVESKQFGWYQVPFITICSTKLTHPSVDVINAQVAEFMDVSDSEIEVVEEDDSRAR